MALIKCPECGQEISDKSDKCIHCGFPLRNTPFLQENINGKYYDINFLTDKSISQAKKITMLREMTNYDIDLMDAKKMVLKYHPTIQQQESNQKEQDERSKNQIHCPKCNSTAITTGARGVSWFWGTIGSSKTVNRCANCGYTWKPNGR